MQISLSSELEQLVKECVDGGMYPSANEVIRAGLHLLKEQEELRKIRLAELQKDIAVGIEQADRRELIPGDEVFKRLYEKLEQKKSLAQ